MRGLQQMIEGDRYCLDVVQQINVLTAAAREVSLIVLGDHLRVCVADAVKESDGAAAIKEMITVLDKVLRQQIGSCGVCSVPALPVEATPPRGGERRE